MCSRHRSRRIPWQGINESRVCEVALRMGLTRPVALYRGMPSWFDEGEAAGIYDMLSDPQHDIYLHPSLSARGAAYTLIHELQHAVQRERRERRGIPTTIGATLAKLEETLTGYDDTPAERDANAQAKALLDEFNDLVS